MNSHKKILIIEDDSAISLALQQVLSDIGHEVDLAINGKDGLDHLINRIPPDLIILDLSLPVMNGIEFRKHQLEIPYLASIPVLMISADACVKTRSRLANIQHYLRKPFELNELLEVMERI